MVDFGECEPNHTLLKISVIATTQSKLFKFRQLARHFGAGVTIVETQFVKKFGIRHYQRVIIS